MKTSRLQVTVLQDTVITAAHKVSSVSQTVNALMGFCWKPNSVCMIFIDRKEHLQIIQIITQESPAIVP